jgi:hypothetical protein
MMRKATGTRAVSVYSDNKKNRKYDFFKIDICLIRRTSGNEDKTMNDNRIIMSLGAFILCIIFCLQASTIGCSKNNAADAESAGADANHSAFFSNSEEDSNEPVEWGPVADNVFAQVIDLHKNDPFSIQAIDKGVSGQPAVRVVLNPFDGNSATRDMLNGFYFLYSDFPNQNTYVVQLGDDSVTASWDNLSKLAESGYTCESSDLDLDWYWGMVTGEPDVESHDAGFPVIEVQ